MGWLFVLALAALIVCILIIRRLHQDRDRQYKMKERLRTSRMYAGLGRMLHQLPANYVERVDIRREGVTVLLLNGKQVRYLFEEHNTDNVQPQAMEVLAQAVATDLNVIQDADYFELKRLIEHTPGGEEITSYAYILRPSRKNYLLRALKDKGVL